jgi:cytoskeletal protein CcmA (bactofilin family)
MFKNKEKSKSSSFAAESISIISAGMKVNGDIESEHDMRIDGNIKGHVYCKAKVVLGPSGEIEGDLHAVNADIFGTVNGNVATKELLCLKSKCFINGNISVGRLDIEPEAEFNGQCTMMHTHASENPKMIGALSLQEN